MTAYIIISGHNHAGLQGQPPFSWETLWQLVKIGVAVGCAASIYFAFMTRSERETGRVERRLWWLSAVGLGGTALWLFLARENYLGDSGMRILWQLIQSTVCGLVLLAGCNLIFGRRGGIVLIHAGVGLMMFGQFFVSKYDVEEQMRIQEGQTRSYGEDIRRTELAIIDSSDPKEDQVAVIPRSLLVASEGGGESSLFSRQPAELHAGGIIRHSALPFDLQVVKYYRNADVRDARPDEANLATEGMGKRFIAEPAKPAAGADTGGAVDLAAA
jgi:hypothetical protein